MFLGFMNVFINQNLKYHNDKYFIQDIENKNKNLLRTIIANCIYAL